jgi:diguanylate cyclase (GGDEF)-like protein/PAS domain S-box-containing protein
LGNVAKQRDEFAPKTPIVLVCNEVDEAVIATAMAAGARDAVSLNNAERLQGVAIRELRACQLEKALARVMHSASEYKRELSSLKQITVEAIADIQEGIIVSANPAWLELFGFPDDADIEGHPIMDLASKGEQPALKGGLVACERDKWRNEKLAIRGRRTDGEEFPVEFSLEKITHDDAPAVRMVVAPHGAAHAAAAPESIVEHAVWSDPVTGFYTRQHFFDALAERLQTAPKRGVRALLYIRPDRFSKAVNDVGVIGTEKIIRQIAQVMREIIQPRDIYGRFGGTIFTVMLERGTMTDVEAWIENLLRRVSSTVFEHDQHSTVLTLSAGLCEIEAERADPARLLLEAERACRTARQKGGNVVELNKSSGEAKKVRDDDTMWTPRIRSALTENRMRLEHQPVGSLNSDIENAFDTLVRIVEPNGNTILPREFMEVAERTGLSKAIDRWVIGASFSFCKANQANLLFVRLSRESVLDETLLDWVCKHVNDCGINPKQICFEVSEDVAVRHLRQVTDLANSLDQLGFRFAIEHFGLSADGRHLVNIVPMRYIKIDGSLMQGLHKDAAQQNALKKIVQIARDKNIYTIAERVQDANTMAVLWQLGISFIQGDYVQSREIVIESMSTATFMAKTLLEGVN